MSSYSIDRPSSSRNLPDEVWTAKVASFVHGFALGGLAMTVVDYATDATEQTFAEPGWWRSRRWGWEVAAYTTSAQRRLRELAETFAERHFAQLDEIAEGAAYSVPLDSGRTDMFHGWYRVGIAFAYELGGIVPDPYGLGAAPGFSYYDTPSSSAGARLSALIPTSTVRGVVASADLDDGSGEARVEWESFPDHTQFAEPFTSDDELYLYVQDGRDDRGERITEVIVGVHGPRENPEYRTFADLGVAWAWVWAMRARYLCGAVACPSAVEYARRTDVPLDVPAHMLAASC